MTPGRLSPEEETKKREEGLKTGWGRERWISGPSDIVFPNEEKSLRGEEGGEAPGKGGGGSTEDRPVLRC